MYWSLSYYWFMHWEGIKKMKIDILGIFNKGQLDKEFLFLKAIFDVNLSFYMIHKSIYLTSTSISRNAESVFWFEEKQIKSGDYIAIYSCEGKSNEIKTNDGKIIHTYYWGSSKALWNNKNDCAVIFEINGWNTSKFE